MRFGLSFASQPAMIPVAVEAEELGYDSVGFYDTPLVCSDPFVVAGVVASRTSSIRIGITVAIPYLRLPHVLATAVGTLNELAPGRITLGFGTGYTGAQTTGSQPDTWATVREHVRVCRGLLDGEEVATEIKGEQRRIAHLHPERGYVNVSDRVPILISALGPKGMAVTAELADGLYTIVAGRRATAEAVAPLVESFRAETEARSRGKLPIALITAMAVRDEGESLDSERLRRFQGPWLTSHLHGDLGASSQDPDAPAPVREASAAYARLAAKHREDAPWIENHHGHSIFVRDEEREIVTGAALEAVCQIGTGEELRAEIRELEAIGIDEIIWQCVPGSEAEVRRFAGEVITPYRAESGTS